MAVILAFGAGVVVGLMVLPVLRVLIGWLPLADYDERRRH